MKILPSSVRSFISLVFLFCSLFSIAFLKMEERRQSYHVMQLNRELKKKMELRRGLEVKKLNALRPQKIEREIQKRTALNEGESDQIIHLPSVLSSLNVKKSESSL